MAQAFGMPAFPVDTHIWRLAMRWGLSAPGSTVLHVERDLKALFPEEAWSSLHLQFIFFGRQHCAAVRHDAATCPICSWAGVEMAAAEGAAASTPRKVAPGSAAKLPRNVTPAKRERAAPVAAARALPTTP